MGTSKPLASSEPAPQSAAFSGRQLRRCAVASQRAKDEAAYIAALLLVGGVLAFLIWWTA